jgi:hypothetical protein
MINSTDILLAWTRIGWNEPSKTDYTSILDTDNKKSDSGLKFDALHALANFVNVKDTYPDASASASVLNALLKAWQQNAILEVTKDVFKEDFIEDGILLDEPIDFSEKLANSGLFVGWKIIVPPGFVLTIKSVELLFDSVRTFNLYVFNESSLAPLSPLKAVTTVANSVKIESWDYSLYGKSSSYKTGTYYVGYFQNDLLTTQAIDRQFYGKDSSCFFEAIQATPNGTNLPLHDNVAYSGYTFGLNLDYVVRKDFTDKYLNNVTSFDRAIGISVICKLLEQIHFSPRINQSERNAKDAMGLISAKAYLDLNGTAEDNPEVPYKRGLLKEYQDEVKNLRNQFFNKKPSVCTIK